MKSLIVPYRTYSEGARALREHTGILFARRNTRRKFPRNCLLINWGSSVGRFPTHRLSNSDSVKIINQPYNVEGASNKLVCFSTLDGWVNTVPWTESRSEALKWLPSPIVCRTLLSSHSGKGIVIAESEEDVVEAKLYTKYIKKTREVRVHVINEKIVLIQEKKRKHDVPDSEVNWQVRNKYTGFAYTFKNVKPVDRFALADAIKAVNILGLDFAAVDMIYNKKENKWYILEINTAPGLSGNTLEIYSKHIKEFK